MPTRSLIVLEKEDESYDVIYCHYDGYPEGVGAMLLENYNTKELVEKLISNGDMSSIGETTEECVFYHRDMREDLNIRRYKTKAALAKAYKDNLCGFLYIFNKDGWYCNGKKLEEILKIKIMNKEQAKAKLRKAQSDLRSAKVTLEMHEQGVQKIKEDIAILQAIIDKPDKWQDSLVQPNKEQYFYLRSNADKGLTVGLDIEVYRKPEHAFRTEEQAELIKEKTLLMWEMYNFAHVRNEGWMPDWGNTEQQKHGITQNGNDAEVDFFTRANSFVFGVAVKNRTIAEEMLEIFGERIEKFYNKQY